MTLPTVKLSSEARAELVRLMSGIGGSRQLAAIIWSQGGATLQSDGTSDALSAGWTIGFHDAAKVPQENVVEIDGIPFALEPDSAKRKLSGRTVEFDGKHFRVTDIAP